VVPPAVGVLGVVQPVELVGVVVEAVGGCLGLVEVLPVLARGSLLLGALADDVKLLAGHLHDLFQRLFKVHCWSLASVVRWAYSGALIFSRLGYRPPLMEASTVGEVLRGVWRFESVHPDWVEEDGGEDGWERTVAWFAVSTSSGLLLIDPLVVGWPELDALVDTHGGCAGVVRTLHWHHRSVAEAAARYDVSVWAKPPSSPNRDWPPFDRALDDGDELPNGARAFAVQRDDELALWLPAHAALVFGDAMLRRPSGELRMCPDSWLQPEGGPERLRELLAPLADLPVEHVLVAHGPLVLGDGQVSLRAAIRRG
jgi:hypothetical protein